MTSIPQVNLLVIVDGVRAVAVPSVPLWHVVRSYTAVMFDAASDSLFVWNRHLPSLGTQRFWLRGHRVVHLTGTIGITYH